MDTCVGSDGKGGGGKASGIILGGSYSLLSIGMADGCGGGGG